MYQILYHLLFHTFCICHDLDTHRTKSVSLSTTSLIKSNLSPHHFYPFTTIRTVSSSLILVILSYCNFSQVLRLCFSLPHKYDQPYPFTSFLIHYPFFYGFDSLYISHFPIPPFPIVLSLNIHTLFYPLHHTLFVYSHSHT